MCPPYPPGSTLCGAPTYPCHAAFLYLSPAEWLLFSSLAAAMHLSCGSCSYYSFGTEHVFLSGASNFWDFFSLKIAICSLFVASYCPKFLVEKRVSTSRALVSAQHPVPVFGTHHPCNCPPEYSITPQPGVSTDAPVGSTNLIFLASFLQVRSTCVPVREGLSRHQGFAAFGARNIAILRESVFSGASEERVQYNMIRRNSKAAENTFAPNGNMLGRGTIPSAVLGCWVPGFEVLIHTQPVRLLRQPA